MSQTSDQSPESGSPQKERPPSRRRAEISLKKKAERMVVAHQFECFMTYGVNLVGRTIYYPTPPHAEGETGEVNTGGSRYFLKGLEFLRLCFPGEEIRVLMNTPGGEDYQGFLVYDAIRDRRYENRIVIEGYGHLMSMGAFILQAGHRRILHSNTRLMVHVGSWGGVELHSIDFDRAAKENKECRKIYRDVLHARIREKHPEHSEEDMERLVRFDSFLSAKEAVDLGLADEVI